MSHFKVQVWLTGFGSTGWPQRRCERGSGPQDGSWGDLGGLLSSDRVAPCGTDELSLACTGMWGGKGLKSQVCNDFNVLPGGRETVSTCL